MGTLDPIEFWVEIVDPCRTATLTIDENDLWFKKIDDPVDNITLLQFVNYDVRTIEWNDSIVTKSLPEESSDLCGALTFDLKQINMNSGAQVNLDSRIFTINGLNTNRATLDV